MILYGRTRSIGEIIADCRAHPRATHSSGFSVQLRPKFCLSMGVPIVSATCFLTSGIRVLPPINCTLAISAAVSFARRRASLIGVGICSAIEANMVSKLFCVIFPRKSCSWYKHSRPH